MDVNKLLQDGISSRAFPGAVWAVGGADGLDDCQAVGLLDPDDPGVPMKPDTLFDIASLTKLIATWAGIGVLWEQQRLDLDDCLAKHLPDVVGHPLGAVTVRHLLTHTAGVPLRANLRPSYGDDSRTVRLGVLREPLHRPPGEAVEYTDRAALILGFLIEQSVDRPLDAFVDAAVWRPLGMTGTRFGPLPPELAARSAPTELDDDTGTRVRGSVHDFSARLLRVCGIAGVFSDAADLGRFARHLLNPEASAGFGASWTRESLRLQTGVLRPERGLFWHPVPLTTAADDVWGHYGFTGTAMWISPTRNRWAVLLTNKLYYSRERKAIAEIRTAFRRHVFGSL